MDANHLAALSAVLRHGSFEIAAAELGVTPSAISQRIKAFEDRVGTPLVLRGQPCTATPAGARLAQHADNVALMEADLLREMRPDMDIPRPKLRIAVNADSLATWFPPALADVPDVLFDLLIDDQDHSDAWLKRGEVSAAVTSKAAPALGCNVTPLGALRYIATASPAFVAQWFHDGLDAASAAQAPMMVFNAKDKLQSRWLERVLGHPVLPPTHMMPSTHAFVDAALAGLGWGMNPEALVREHLARGNLVALRPDAPLDVPLYWQVSRMMQIPLVGLTRSVRRQVRSHLLTQLTEV